MNAMSLPIENQSNRSATARIMKKGTGAGFGAFARLFTPMKSR
jgi:hypothetical protein